MIMDFLGARQLPKIQFNFAKLFLHDSKQISAKGIIYQITLWF